MSDISRAEAGSVALDRAELVALQTSLTVGNAVDIRLGRALKHLLAQVIDPQVGEAEREALAAELEQIIEIDPTEPEPAFPSSRYATEEYFTIGSGSFSINPRGSHPLAGVASPAGTPYVADIVQTPDGERVSIGFAFDARHEGLPGRAHGGYVAAAFDTGLAQAARLTGATGPTGTLTVRFEAPTTIGEPLAMYTWLVERSGRKVFTAGELRHADTDELFASATAVFIRPREAMSP